MSAVIHPWSLDYIMRLVQEAAYQAKQDRLEPALARAVSFNCSRIHRFNIPFLGDYLPQGWERVETDDDLIVDRTGTVKPGTPGLVHSQQEFQKYVNDLAYSKSDGEYGLGVVEQRQTQVTVAVYRRIA